MSKRVLKVKMCHVNYSYLQSIVVSLKPTSNVITLLFILFTLTEKEQAIRERIYLAATSMLLPLSSALLHYSVPPKYLLALDTGKDANQSTSLYLTHHVAPSHLCGLFKLSYTLPQSWCRMSLTSLHGCLSLSTFNQTTNSHLFSAARVISLSQVTSYT